MAKGLTKRQSEVLGFLKGHIKEHGYGPSLRDICAFLSINGPNNARKHLDSLEKKGFIKREPRKSRAIEILEPIKSGIKDLEEQGTPEWFFSRAVSVPIAGRVRAGMPELAIEDIEGYVTLDSSFFKCRGAYLLRAVGDSMIEAGIENDDFLLIRPQNDAQINDIVIAMIDDEATVKRFIQKDGRIALKPENSTMKPIIIDGTKKFEIIGKVVDVIKRFEK